MALILLNSFELVNIHSALLNLFSNLHKKEWLSLCISSYFIFYSSEVDFFLIHIKINA